MYHYRWVGAKLGCLEYCIQQVSCVNTQVSVCPTLGTEITFHTPLTLSPTKKSLSGLS